MQVMTATEDQAPADDDTLIVPTMDMLQTYYNAGHEPAQGDEDEDDEDA